MTSAGPVNATENPMDVALNGPGFIGVQNDQGETLYTRSGNFLMDADGTMITTAGQRVAGQGGGPITIPQGSTEIKIDERGNVSNQDGQIGQMMIVEFPDVQLLEARGNNTYATEQAGTPAENTVVKQGFLEGANVQPVLEMTRMIETSRTFQQIQQTLQGEHERLRDAIQKLTGSS
jgi:flagellar basal-body rod protein FlgF